MEHDQRFGNMRTYSGTDSRGNSFNYTCGQFGCSPHQSLNFDRDQGDDNGLGLNSDEDDNGLGISEDDDGLGTNEDDLGTNEDSDGDAFSDSGEN